jgi:hypothetical protein
MQKSSLFSYYVAINYTAFFLACQLKQPLLKNFTEFFSNY